MRWVREAGAGALKASEGAALALKLRETTALALLTAVAAALRLPGVFSGLWRDEGSTYFDATAANLAATLREIRLAEINPPGFFLLMRGWLALAGTSDVTMQLPAFVFGVLLIPATYALGRAAGLRGAAFLAAAFAAFETTGIDLSSDARPYTCAALLAALVTLAAFRVLEGGGEVRTLARPLGLYVGRPLGLYVGRPLGLYVAAPVALYVAAAVVLEYVSYTGLLLGFGLTLGGLAAAAFRRARAPAAALVAASAVAAAFLLPWYLSLRGVAAVAPDWLEAPAPGVLPGRILEQFGFVLPTAFMHVPFAVALLVALVVSVATRRASPQVTAGAVALVTGLAIEAGALLREPRYAFSFTPLANVLIALALAALFRACVGFVTAPSRGLRSGLGVRSGLAIALGLALAISSALGARAQLRAWARTADARSGMRALVAAARPDLGPGTLIVVAPDYLGPSLGYYLRDVAAGPTLGFANATDPEHFRCCAAWRRSGLTTAALSAIRSKARGFDRIAFVYDPEAADRGDVPFGQALVLRAELLREFPVRWDRRYPGDWEPAAITLFTLPRAQSRPRRSTTH